MNKNIGIIKCCFHSLRISYHIRADISFIKLKSFDHFESGSYGLAIFYCDNSILPHFIHSFSDKLTNSRIIGGNRSYLSNFVFIFNGNSHLFQLIHDEIDSFVNSLAHKHTVSTSRNVFHTFTDNCASQNCSCCGTISSYIICLGSNFFYKLSSCIFKRIFQFDFFRNGNTVVGNCGRSKFFLKNNITSFRTKCYTNSISYFINTTQHCMACFFTKSKDLRHFYFPP
ncbi:hypothetical protein SDC9_156917 [bioreactor metagenome]|uniref:Uncharacterized protein n=1 Tax=bioreactor metagenome TaxID=1076179 RepID=A0A645F7K0_9ZZZZ